MNSKRGQITIFIIIAMIIIILGILIYLFYPEIKTTLGFQVENPSVFIQECIEKDVEDAIKLLSSQGGSINPKHYILYKDEKIEYLCYTPKYYITCTVQQPMLKSHIESEIIKQIEEKSKKCFDDLEESYKKKNYDVDLKRGDEKVELLPNQIVITFENPITLTKGEDSEEYGSFSVVVNNNLYELISIANSILNWETTYGDSETTIYMNYYPDKKVEKKLQSDGTTIYILTNRNTGDKFQFASRSVAWPPGF